MSVLDEQVDVDLTVLEELDFEIVCTVRMALFFRILGNLIPAGQGAPCGAPLQLFEFTPIGGA